MNTMLIYDAQYKKRFIILYGKQHGKRSNCFGKCMIDVYIYIHILCMYVYRIFNMSIELKLSLEYYPSECCQKNKGFFAIQGISGCESKTLVN